MATEKRLVDVNEVKQKLRAVREWFIGHPSSEQDKLAQAVAKLCIEEIDKIKPVDAVEVVHGRWEKAYIAGYLKCNCCKDAFICEEWLESGKWNYCPNCGAKMEGWTE